MTDPKWPPTAVLAELKRELQMRQHVYLRQVQEGRLTRQLADRRIEIVQQLIAEYEAKVAEQNPDMFGGS